LCLIAFEMEIYDCLLISASLDLMNAGILTLIYGYRKKIHYPFAAIFCIPALTFQTILFYFILRPFGECLEVFFKGTVGILVLIIAVGFFVKAFVERKRQQKRDKQADLVVREGMMGLIYTYDDGTTEEIVSPSTMFDSRMYAAKIIPNTTGKKIGTCLMCVLAGIFSVIIGMGSGFFGFGSGVLFVILFLVIYQFDIVLATGTGLLIMFMMAGWLTAMLLVSVPQVKYDFVNSLWKYILIANLGSVLGVIVGVLFIIKIPKIYITFAVAITLLIVGVYATVQPIILHFSSTNEHPGIPFLACNITFCYWGTCPQITLPPGYSFF